jgi:hypothetical protein
MIFGATALQISEPRLRNPGSLRPREAMHFAAFHHHIWQPETDPAAAWLQITDFCEDT